MTGHVSRRDLIQWSAFLAQSGSTLLRGAEAAPGKEGTWIPVACFNHCGGRCPNYAYVLDGVVTRLKSDDTHPDSPDYPQQRGCARGRAQRFQVFGADRLKYPMKRRHWQPGGGGRELRGRDEWVRIPWDEALDLVAAEIKRIKTQYGNQAILFPSSGDMGRVFKLYGGCVEAWGEVSWGAWPEAYRHVTGVTGARDTGNDRMRLRQAKLIVLWGANPAWSSGGVPSFNYLQAKKAGARFIVVDPHYSDSAQLLADEWIPVRPGTDTALLLGMAYQIITKGLHDTAFLDRYCVGFDRDHMPAGANPAENFKDYVLGASDGEPKTPEWASGICGTAPDLIRRFAEEYARTKPALIQSGCAPARINRGEQFPHALLTLAFMTGNIGVPGSGVGPNFYMWAGNAGPALVTVGPSGVPAPPTPAVDCKINNCELWDAVLKGTYTGREGEKKSIDIRLIYHENGSALNQKVGAIKAVAAHRRVEFVVSQNYVLNPNCQYSDIVLPVTTPWEKYGRLEGGNREILLWSSQVTAPLFEARDDVWIAREVGRRLGIDPEEIDPLPLKQQIFNGLKGAKVIREDGKTWEPLVTITAADIQEMGVTGEPQTGRIRLPEFRKKGIYQVPRSDGDKLGYTALEEFRRDPEGKRLATPSGKLEIHSKPLADFIAAIGFDRKSPLPKYEPMPEGYEQTFADWGEKIKSDHPLQLITIHYPRRAHSAFDNIPQMREAFPQEFMMNSLDAEARGIRNGDTVLIRSRHGQAIRPALVTARVMPGVTLLGEGAWLDLDENTGIDRAGSTNVLNGATPTGQGHTGFNSCIVQVEKYAKPLPPDAEWPRKMAAGEVRHE